MSMQQKRIMEDTEGRAICGFRKKMMSMSGAAHITVDDQSGATLAIATIKSRTSFPIISGADIYFHDPPMHIDNVTTDGLPVAIYVEGNIMRREYDFMIGNMNDNPFKIARVVCKGNLNGQESYFIEIGPNVDVAFMSMCTYAIDELFSDKN